MQRNNDLAEITQRTSAHGQMWMLFSWSLNHHLVLKIITATPASVIRRQECVVDVNRWSSHCSSSWGRAQFCNEKSDSPPRPCCCSEDAVISAVLGVNILIFKGELFHFIACPLLFLWSLLLAFTASFGFESLRSSRIKTRNNYCRGWVWLFPSACTTQASSRSFGRRAVSY